MANFKMVELREICSVIAGQSPPSTDYNADKNGLPFFQGKADFGELYPIPRVWCSSPIKIAIENDILFSVRAPVGPTNIANSKCCIGRGLSAIRPGDKLNNKFLLHYFRHMEPLLSQKGSGSTFKAITQADLLSINIPLPPLPEQKRIAEVLDKADELRAKCRAAIEKLDSLTQSIFLEMFGNPVTNPKGLPVRNIGDLLKSASYGTSEKSEAIGKYPVLRMNNITRTGEMDFKDLKYMDLDDDLRDRYLVKKGDVLFNRTNSADLVGKTAIFRDSRQMAYAGYLICLRVNDENNPEYLAAFLNTGYSKRMLRGMCKSIIGMANINATEIQAMKIPQPTLPMQNNFADRIAAVEKLKSSHRASLEKLDALFASLQDRAFKGKL